MISIHKLEKLNEIFSLNGWSTDKTESSLFNRFSALLAKLEEEQQDFILKLTKYYNVYKVEDYEAMIEVCLNRLNENGYFDGTKVIILPLLPHCHADKKIKSSMFLGYLLKSNKMSYYKFLSNTDIEVYSRLDDQDVDLIAKKEAKLLLVDDYIGSGITASQAIKTYLQCGISSEDITVLGLIIDQKGKDIMTKLNIGYVSAINSEYTYFTVQDLFENEFKAREHLNIIAKKLKIGKTYKAGYNDTMALLSMVRTPNNTIPFFWFEGRRKEQAPFARFKEG